MQGLHDKEAVWSVSEDDLASLGLIEKGDVLTLKSFCIPINNGKFDKEYRGWNSQEKAKVTWVKHEISFSWMGSIRQGFWKIQVYSS